MKFKTITLVFAVLSNFNVFCMNSNTKEDNQDSANVRNVQRVFNFEEFKKDPFNEKNFEQITEENDIKECFKHFLCCVDKEKEKYFSITYENNTIQRESLLLKSKKLKNDYIKNNSMLKSIEVEAVVSDMESEFVKALNELRNTYEKKWNGAVAKLAAFLEFTKQIDNRKTQKERNKEMFYNFKKNYEAFRKDIEEELLEKRKLEEELMSFFIEKKEKDKMFFLMFFCIRH